MLYNLDNGNISSSQNNMTISDIYNTGMVSESQHMKGDLFLMGKAKYWVAVCYLENMKENWKDEISELLEVPFAYCVHDKDLDNVGEDRKAHVHIMIAFPNTTTYNTAFTLFSRLSAPYKKCLNTCKEVFHVRNMYDYLIHDTEDCRKKNKHQYNSKERITGNNFDIGDFEQISLEEKRQILKDCAVIICSQGFINFTDFYCYAISNMDDKCLDVINSHHGLLNALTKGNYQRYLMKKEKERKNLEKNQK